MPFRIVSPDSWSTETLNEGPRPPARQRDRHLLLVGLGLGLDLHLDDGIGKIHLLEDDRLLRIAQRLAGARVLEALQGNDVAGVGLISLLALGGVHEVHAAGPLLLLARGVGERHALLELAR